ISVYPPLSAARSPSDGELVDGFRPFAERLRAWAARTNERYLFTEVGYPALPTAAARPWDYRAAGPVDLAMQQRCYRALFRAWHADPRLAGVYLWNWFGPGGPADPGYSPRGKPALQVIRRWYMGSRARSKEPR
ncbi:MAG: hypothetical protein KC620_00690, partial [Myxococcales bacterium]|nr:hypothetical protein [Myxococcales bacterium]